MAMNGTGYYYIAKREWENSILFHFYFSSAEVAVAVVTCAELLLDDISVDSSHIF